MTFCASSFVTERGLNTFEDDVDSIRDLWLDLGRNEQMRERERDVSLDLI